MLLSIIPTHHWLMYQSCPFLILETEHLNLFESASRRFYTDTNLSSSQHELFWLTGNAVPVPSTAPVPSMLIHCEQSINWLPFLPHIIVWDKTNRHIPFSSLHSRIPPLPLPRSTWRGGAGSPPLSAISRWTIRASNCLFSCVVHTLLLYFLSKPLTYQQCILYHEGAAFIWESDKDVRTMAMKGEKPLSQWLSRSKESKTNLDLGKREQEETSHTYFEASVKTVKDKSWLITGRDTHELRGG